MKTTQTVLAAVFTVCSLSASIANAGPQLYRHAPVNIGYQDSFNSNNQRQTRIDNSRVFDSDTHIKYDVDNSKQYKFRHDYRWDSAVDIRNTDLDARQNLYQQRDYTSSTSQNGINAGSATGHSLNQQQGSTAVGALVSESSRDTHRGHNLLSPSFISNSGSSNKGNLSQSQIGSNQSGVQAGDVANFQVNDQGQRAVSYVGSVDSVSNSAHQ